MSQRWWVRGEVIKLSIKNMSRYETIGSQYIVPLKHHEALTWSVDQQIQHGSLSCCQNISQDSWYLTSLPRTRTRAHTITDILSNSSFVRLVELQEKCTAFFEKQWTPFFVFLWKSSTYETSKFVKLLHFAETYTSSQSLVISAHGNMSEMQISNVPTRGYHGDTALWTQWTHYSWLLWWYCAMNTLLLGVWSETDKTWQVFLWK